MSSIRSKDPVIFLEPKILYRSAVEEVPDADYEIPLGKGEIMQSGKDVTVVGWGAQLRLSKLLVISRLKKAYHVNLLI